MSPSRGPRLHSGPGGVGRRSAICSAQPSRDDQPGHRPRAAHVIVATVNSHGGRRKAAAGDPILRSTCGEHPNPLRGSSPLLHDADVLARRSWPRICPVVRARMPPLQHLRFPVGDLAVRCGRGSLVRHRPPKVWRGSVGAPPGPDVARRATPEPGHRAGYAVTRVAMRCRNTKAAIPATARCSIASTAETTTSEARDSWIW
jgi:hypothetical protein